MNRAGDSNLLVEARSALLDALEALRAQRGAVVLIGAQAIYLHTGSVDVALAEATKDSDLALDVRALSDHPQIEKAMEEAGFVLNPNGQPGAWLSRLGVPVDVMIPAAQAGPRKGRGIRVPPHSNRAARRTIGLEAAVVDHAPMRVEALADGDSRAYEVNVAGPGALLVAKLHKLGERAAEASRLVDKDAHDSYRILAAISTADLAGAFRTLLDDALSRSVTEQALHYLEDLFAAGPEALGCLMAGRAEEGIGDPDFVASATYVLAGDLLAAVHNH